MTTTEIKQKIPSCTINKTTIKKIAELLDSEINKIPDEEKKHSKPKFDIRIESKKRKVTIHDSKELELQEIPRDLQRIRMNFRWYHKPEMDIDIDFGFQWWNTPEIEISGTDPMWVNGILGQITDILTQNPTKNDLLHNNSTKIPILLAISILFGIGVYFITPSESTPEAEDFTFILGVPLIAMSAAFSLLMFSFSFVPWFFPLVEFEGRGIQKKLRKVILIIVSTIILGIIGTGIYEYILKVNPS